MNSFSGRSHDLFDSLRDPKRWRYLSMRFYHGAHWQHDTCELVRRVVLGIADALVQFDAPFRVACLYPDDSKTKIEGVIVFTDSETCVVPLKLTPRLVRIGERRAPVFTGHAPGPMLLVHALTDEIKRAYEYVTVTGA